MDTRNSSVQWWQQLAAILLLFGVRATIVSAPDQKNTAKRSERANQYVRKNTDIMEANGDATNEDSLRMYCTMKEIQANHIQCQAGHSNYEMCFGKEPLTIFDLLTQGNMPTEFRPAGTGDNAELDTDFYETLRARVTDLTHWDIEQADERSREHRNRTTRQGSEKGTIRHAATNWNSKTCSAVFMSKANGKRQVLFLRRCR